ncbi:MAG: RsiV family protein [Bacteroidales bacterium]|nr:RsiV family protein [Bacteroidales bacterium]
MKKFFIPIVLLLLFVIGCNRTNPNEVDVESYTLCDSVFIESDFGDDYSYYRMNVELPITGNEILRKNIIHWILSDDTEDYKTYFQADKDRFFEEEGDEPRSTFDGNYTLSEQTDLYVTYISEGYAYTGGAHPLPWYYGISFSKADGCMLGYDMFEDPEQLIGLISENIRNQYFSKYNTEEEEYLFEPDEPFQLPTNQPWIETDSVVFCYGPFEIAPYAAGMPLCKISKTDLMPYLNEKGKSVLY